MDSRQGPSLPLKQVWLVNDLMGEGALHVVASPTVRILRNGKAAKDDLLWYGAYDSPKGAPFPLKGGRVGATVWVASNWESGCCYEVVGVFLSKAQALLKGAENVSEHVVEGPL